MKGHLFFRGGDERGQVKQNIYIYIYIHFFSDSIYLCPYLSSLSKPISKYT